MIRRVWPTYLGYARTAGVSPDALMHVKLCIKPQASWGKTSLLKTTVHLTARCMSAEPRCGTSRTHSRAELGRPPADRGAHLWVYGAQWDAVAGVLNLDRTGLGSQRIQCIALRPSARPLQYRLSASVGLPQIVNGTHPHCWSPSLCRSGSSLTTSQPFCASSAETHPVASPRIVSQYPRGGITA